MASKKTGNTPATITQADLREYLAQEKVHRKHQQLRQDLLAKIDAGAAIEPGDLTVLIETYFARNLSRTILTELLGSERTRQIIDLIRPASHRRLRIESARRAADGLRPAQADLIVGPSKDTARRQ